MQDINNDEIDLRKVARHTKVYLFENSKKAITYSKKHFSKLLIIGSLSVFVGGSYTYFKANFYKSVMIGTSNMLNTEDVALIINNFQTLLEEKGYQELYKLISLDSLELTKIKYIKIKKWTLPNAKKTKESDKNDKETKEELTDIQSNKFNIEVGIMDCNLIDKLNIVVPEMIRNNDYTKLRVKIAIENNISMYNRIDNEIHLLDSMKLSMSPGISTTNDRTIFYTSSPSSVHETILNLFGRQLGIKEFLEFRQDFLVVHSFIKYKKPVNKGIIDYLTAIVVTFIMIIFIYITIKSIFKMWRNDKQVIVVSNDLV